MTRSRRLLAALALGALVLTACSTDEAPDLEFGLVTSGEVVETVAAPATIQPRDRVGVSAPATGVVAELFVEDGDEVRTGDPLLRLDAPTVEQSIAQAEAAVAAADALAGVRTGVDLSPLIGSVRTQFDAVIPALLETLTVQARALEEPARTVALDAIAEATSSYAAAAGSLREAEQQAAASARAADAGTRAAAAAQRAQAELALDAANSRADDLLVTAPAAGVVELARGGATTAPPLGLDATEFGDLGSLLGGGTATSTSSGPIAEGSEVSAGQALATIYDLSGFSARTTIDEIDAVVVTEGQRAVVLVDALGDQELAGIVDHVGLQPETGSGGGVAYPVDVRLIGLTSDLALRPGLSGSAEIVVNRVEADTVVPSSALRRRGGREVVYVVRDGVIHEVPVVVLAIGNDDAAVEGDVDVGAQIVVRGIEDVADGDPVP